MGPCFNGYCKSRYGSSVEGSISDVEKACSRNPRCKMFDYRSEFSNGHICSTFEIVNENIQDYRVCRIAPGTYNPHLHFLKYESIDLKKNDNISFNYLI